MTRLESCSPEELSRGYREDEAGYTCILCGKRFENGEIFPLEDRFFEASRAIELHLSQEHRGKLLEIFEIGGKYLPLTEKQKELWVLFGEGLPDREIAERLNITVSTVRHQKFVFRERAKEARLYTAAWDLVEERLREKREMREKRDKRDKQNQRDTEKNYLTIHEGATMVDQRYAITEEENRKILENVFFSLEPLRLKVFSAKEKKKIVILRRLSQEFEPGRMYTEKEVNRILGEIYADFATLRRYLVEYGYLSRTADCKTYWRPSGLADSENL